MDTYSDPQSLKDYERGRDDFDYDILKEISIPDNSSIIEIGCGNGRFLRKLHALNPTIKITGLDSSRTGIDSCTDGIFICTDVRGYVSEIKYDYVLCFQTLEHFPDPDTIVTKLLELGDKLIISVPNKYLDTCDTHLQHWNVDEFNTFMNKHIAGKSKIFNNEFNIIFISD